MSSTQQSTDLKWEIAPGWEQVLLGPSGVRIPEWLQPGHSAVVKHGAHRTVYRVDLPTRTLYVKHYRCAPWIGVWRHLIDSSHSRREWRRTREVALRQIPTARPVAVVEQQRGWLIGDNYYVCEGIPDSQSVDDYVRQELPRLPPGQQAGQRRELLCALARLIAAAQAQGIEHNDLHTGNILIRWPESGSAPELYLIDLPGIRVGGPLNWARSRDGLAMLGGSWLPRLSRADRWRFWTAYLQNRPEFSGIAIRPASEEVFARMRAHANRIALRRDKRSLRNNRDFQKRKLGSAVAYAVKEYPSEQLAGLMENPAYPLRRHRHTAVKIGHASLLVDAELPLAEQTVRVAYKRSRPRAWWKRLLGVLRRNRAVSAWHTGHALLARGIATARPLAAIQPGKLSRESYLATAWIEGALNLHLYGWELANRHPQERHRRACQVAESLGRLIGRMHGWQISHRDLKGCNLVIVEQAAGVQTYLIDLDSVRFLRRLCPAQQSRDLARLAASMEAHSWVSRTVRLRFLRAYLRERSDGGSWKPLWRAIAQPTQAILDRFRRHERPVA